MILLQEEIKDKTEYCKELTESTEKLQSALKKSFEDNKRLTLENAMFREVAKMGNEMQPTKHGSIGPSISSATDTSLEASGTVLPSQDSATMPEPENIDKLFGKDVIPSWLQNQCLQRDGCHGQGTDSASKLCGNRIDCPDDKVQYKTQMSEDGPDAEYLDCKGEVGSSGKRCGTEPFDPEGDTIVPGARLEEQCTHVKLRAHGISHDRQKDGKIQGRCFGMENSG